MKRHTKHKREGAPPGRILILAGEISGDMYGAALVREMRAASPKPLAFYGIGGDQMRAEGVELLAHVSETGVMGFWEVMRRYGFFARLMRTITRRLDDRRPDLVLTIDYPGFNLRIAARAHARGIKTVHYICPQVWAWHKKRIPKIARILNRLITIFPFEPELFAGTGLNVTFEGHPLADQVATTLAEPDRELPWHAGHRVALFPGSRRSEIARILPDELAAAALLEQRIGPCSFIIPAPTAEARRAVEHLLARLPGRPRRLAVVDGHSRHILRQADAAVIKSGTSTLEGVLMRCPFTIVYRVSPLTHAIFRRLVTGVSHIGLVNILAGKTVCREFIQQQFTPEAVADELTRLIENPDYRSRMLLAFRSVNDQIGGPGASARAAAEVLRMLES